MQGMSVQLLGRPDEGLTRWSIRWYDPERPFRGAPWGVKHVEVIVRGPLLGPPTTGLRAALGALLEQL